MSSMADGSRDTFKTEKKKFKMPNLNPTLGNVDRVPVYLVTFFICYCIALFQVSISDHPTDSSVKYDQNFKVAQALHACNNHSSNLKEDLLCELSFYSAFDTSVAPW